jgi:1-hydroxycarotenoid 3,4-desaturase
MNNAHLGRTPRVGVIGAGIGGLVSAIDLARAGFDVQLLEAAATAGGKMRQVSVAGVGMDAGPTVFTLPRVFEQLFDDAGDDFHSRVRLHPAQTLARHAWDGGGRLDLFADAQRSAHAIGELSGLRDARGFVRFTAQAKRIYDTLDQTFMHAARPSPLQLARRIGLRRLPDLWNIQPFTTLWRATGKYFRDTRLRQLFARYATYCGSSPFAAPATLMLIAHVEQAGVWYIDGGMRELAVQLAALASRLGVRLRYGAPVVQVQRHRGRVCALQLRDGERVEVDAVVSNADNNALSMGLFGEQVRSAARPNARSARTLSAVTLNVLGRTHGFDLAHHTVFFGADYRSEFDNIFRSGRLPDSPTIYVCAQDRRCDDSSVAGRPERLLCLINAPPNGDVHHYTPVEINACSQKILDSLASYGLTVRCEHGPVTTTPQDFDRLFPGSGGSLYGAASHGWRASFTRPGSRSRVTGLYLAGGSTHPGAGVPMAAMSGRLAAACIMEDYASTSCRLRTATRGGTSMA